eukprot:1776989-Amphidinium_carterae.1
MHLGNVTGHLDFTAVSALELQQGENKNDKQTCLPLCRSSQHHPTLLCVRGQVVELNNRTGAAVEIQCSDLRALVRRGEDNSEEKR